MTWRYHELLTWRFEHFVEQALAERRRGATRHTVGPALKNPLEQKSLSSCGLDSEMRELENALCGQDWRPFAPTEGGTWDKGNNSEKRNQVRIFIKYAYWGRGEAEEHFRHMSCSFGLSSNVHSWVRWYVEKCWCQPASHWKFNCHYYSCSGVFRHRASLHLSIYLWQEGMNNGG